MRVYLLCCPLTSCASCLLCHWPCQKVPRLVRQKQKRVLCLVVVMINVLCYYLFSLFLCLPDSWSPYSPWSPWSPWSPLHWHVLSTQNIKYCGPRGDFNASFHLAKEKYDALFSWSLVLQHPFWFGNCALRPSKLWVNLSYIKLHFLQRN